MEFYIMVFLKKFIPILLVFAFFAASQDLKAQWTQIDDFEPIQKQILQLKEKNIAPKDIGVILDFHGVMTDESNQSNPVKLQQGIMDFLGFLEDQQVSYAVATAWKDFDKFIQDIIELGLGEKLNVTKDTSESIKKKTSKGSTLAGFKNGKAYALRKGLSTNQYPQKVFALEVAFPDRIFNHVIIVDDEKNNFKTFSQDFPYTRYSEAELILYHFVPK